MKNTDSKFHTIPGRRDELHEQALYALFDGIRGNQERMAEADLIYARLSFRARLSAVSGERDPNASEALRPSAGSFAEDPPA